MSQVPAVAEVSMAASTPGSEKHATSPASTRTTSSAPAPAPKSRSCVVCRSRKVRCDKQSPCSVCRRANIPCVYPSTNHPPKWTRRLERLNNNAAAANAQVPQDADSRYGVMMDKLRNLENLVKELSGQLEEAHANATSPAAGSPEVNSHARSSQDGGAGSLRGSSPTTNNGGVQKQFGRLVLQDANHSRYVSSGFWSRVDDELEGLKMYTRSLAEDDSESSEDEAYSGMSPSTQELDRTPSERNGFLFRHNLSPPSHEMRDLHPLPSQIPFLLDVFGENVNFIIQIVHMPTIIKMFRDSRGIEPTRLMPANEALMFSIFYAAITSMEEDEVMTNFGSSKSELNLKYRLGLEHALAKADFLNSPSIVLVQAFGIFLALLRRHDSPRFVWMLTGLVIRMAQYLGLQRDGSHFEHLTPFEVETRRKVWWSLCFLDLRTSEDQGTDLTIVRGSFDTKIPLNINDADISPETKITPTERDGVTDMSFVRIQVGLCHIMRQMMALSATDGAAGLEEQSRLVNEIYEKYEEGYFQHSTESGNVAYWVGVTVARLVMAKMTLIVFLPVLFASPSENFSDDIRTKLLVSAIEVAEYNHALNTQQACRHWRWIYQTYTHWHAIVYLMIEISRRPWSPIVERSWVALHTSSLIPAQTALNKNLRIWVPLRKLMAKARKHRDAELNRLRGDPQATTRLEVEDQKLPLPSSSEPLPIGSSMDSYRERWRQLVGLAKRSGDGINISGMSSGGLANPPTQTTYTGQPTEESVSAYTSDDSTSNMIFEPTYLSMNGQPIGQGMENADIRQLEQGIGSNAPSEPAPGQIFEPVYNQFPLNPTDYSDGRGMGPGFTPWLWADSEASADAFPSSDRSSIDVSMDLDGGMNWYNWVESAKGMEYDARFGGNDGMQSYGFAQ